MLIIMLIAGFFIGLKFIRVVGIGEHKVIKIYREMRRHEVTTIEDLWNVNAIENKRIHCFDMSTRIIIKCERGYILNRPKDFMEDHIHKLAAFLGSLCNNEYNVSWYNLKYADANDRHLITTESNIKNLKNKKLQTIGNSYLKTFRANVSSDSTSVSDFFVVSTKNPNLASHIMQAAETAMQYLYGSWYVNVEVLDKPGIVEFTENLMKLRGINVNDLRFGKVGDDEYKVLKLLYFIDKDNNEISLETLNKSKTKQTKEESVIDNENDNINPDDLKKFYAQLRKTKQSNQTIDSENDLVIPINDTDIAIPVEDDEIIPVEDEVTVPVEIDSNKSWENIVIDDDEEL